MTDRRPSIFADYAQVWICVLLFANAIGIVCLCSRLESIDRRLDWNDNRTQNIQTTCDNIYGHVSKEKP